jgi:4-hydroxybenzoyl-CoA thioesterase
MKRFRQTIRIMFSDCDPAQIVFYPAYFRWFDRATQQMFTDVGLPWSIFWPERGMAGLPLVDASAKFMGPARMDDEVVLESWIDEWRGRTFVVKHVITKDGKTIVEGQEIRVWAMKDATTPEGIKAASIPDDIKAKFA